MGGRCQSAGREPGLDLGGADVQIGGCRQINPNKLDMRFPRLHRRQSAVGAVALTPTPAASGGVVGVQLFHMEQLGLEHEVNFVVVGGAVVECGFGGEEQGADGDCLGAFFEQFAFEGF